MNNVYCDKDPERDRQIKLGLAKNLFSLESDLYFKLVKVLSILGSRFSDEIYKDDMEELEYELDKRNVNHWIAPKNTTIEGLLNLIEKKEMEDFLKHSKEEGI